MLPWGISPLSVEALGEEDWSRIECKDEPDTEAWSFDGRPRLNEQSTPRFVQREHLGPPSHLILLT